MMAIINDIAVMCPVQPVGIAYDFRGMAEAVVVSASASAYATPGGDDRDRRH